MRAGPHLSFPLETAATRTLPRRFRRRAVGPARPACLPATAVRCAPRSGDAVQAHVGSTRPLKWVPRAPLARMPVTRSQLNAASPLHKSPPPNLAHCHSPGTTSPNPVGTSCSPPPPPRSLRPPPEAQASRTFGGAPRRSAPGQCKARRPSG